MSADTMQHSLSGFSWAFLLTHEENRSYCWYICFVDAFSVCFKEKLHLLLVLTNSAESVN